MTTHRPLTPLDTALDTLLRHAQPLTPTGQGDTLALLHADGRVLAHTVHAALNVPPLDNSAMDGYALRCADAPAPGVVLPVSQRIVAGSVGQPLQAGTAARIFTGAPIPPGADAVVMQEHCTALEAGKQVRIDTPPEQPGQSLRRAGEDIALGSVVLAAGTRLGPAELGLAASIGLAQLTVARRPRVALFSTGDELVMPGQVPPEALPPGAIYNSNRFFLHHLLQRLGCEVTDLGNIPDQREATVAALRQAATEHDVILTSGGVSVGEEDHVKPAVQALGQLDLWQINMKPGKPFAYGNIDANQDDHRCHFIGLPGNPVSSLVTFMLLVRPFVLRLQGATNLTPRALTAQADFDWPRPDPRREFLRVRLTDNGQLACYPNQSSGVLTSTVWGDGLVDNPPGHAIARGDSVRFVPFSQLLS